MNKHFHRTRNQAAFVAGLAIQMALTGCAADGADAPTEDISSNVEQHLVAEVKLDGYRVSYYEPEPGLLVEFETGDASAAHVQEPTGLDQVQRYEFLSKQKAPKALVAAQQRAGGAGHEGEPIVEESFTPTTPIPRDTAKGIGVADEAWFRANYCQPTDRFIGTPVGFWNLGELNWRDDVKYLRGGAFSPQGIINYRMGYSGGNIPDMWFALNPGQYGAWRNSSIIKRQASSHVMPFNQPYVHCINFHY